MRTNDPVSHFELLAIDKQHPRRQEVEHYIATRYADAFNAQITEFMPTFMAIVDQHQQLLSVCGYRVASEGPLFLEQYLHQPADILMTAHCRKPIIRHQLVEFGQLASFSPGMSPLHFMLMARYLADNGFEWCIFTATDPLYAMMCRLGLELTVLSDANPDCIPDAEATWGTYYHHRPRISAGNLAAGLNKLSERFARQWEHPRHQQERKL